jgi:hypothetical protein
MLLFVLWLIAKFTFPPTGLTSTPTLRERNPFLDSLRSINGVSSAPITPIGSGPMPPLRSGPLPSSVQPSLQEMPPLAAADMAEDEDKESDGHSDDPNDTARQKQMRKEKNRIAAKNCRQRKLDKFVFLKLDLVL